MYRSLFYKISVWDTNFCLARIKQQTASTLKIPIYYADQMYVPALCDLWLVTSHTDKHTCTQRASCSPMPCVYKSTQKVNAYGVFVKCAHGYSRNIYVEFSSTNHVKESCECVVGRGFLDWNDITGQFFCFTLMLPVVSFLLLVKYV